MKFVHSIFFLQQTQIHVLGLKSNQQWKSLAAKQLAQSGKPDPFCHTGVRSLGTTDLVCCAGYCGECSNYKTCKSVRGQASEDACCASKVHDLRCGGGASANECLKSCDEAVPPCIINKDTVNIKIPETKRNAGDDCNKAVTDWRTAAAAAVKEGRNSATRTIEKQGMPGSLCDLKCFGRACCIKKDAATKFKDPAGADEDSCIDTGNVWCVKAGGYIKNKKTSLDDFAKAEMLPHGGYEWEEIKCQEQKGFNLADCSSGCKEFPDLEDALVQCHMESTCGGITQTAADKYAMRKGTEMLVGAGGENSWLVKDDKCIKDHKLGKKAKLFEAAAKALPKALSNPADKYAMRKGTEMLVGAGGENSWLVKDDKCIKDHKLGKKAKLFEAAAKALPKAISNPDFEEGSKTNAYEYASVPGWQSSNTVFIKNGNGAWGGTVGKKGSRFIAIQNKGSHITQKVGSQQAGKKYELKFWAASRKGYTTPTLQVSVDGKILESWSPTVFDFQQKTLEYEASSDTAEISFQNVSPDGKDCTAFIDDVSITLAYPYGPK